jgi:hypothetical protein
VNPLALDDIRPCLEGIIPAIIATCAADGTPNVAYLSQVYYVDPGHVALSFQFFNKTRQNILANPDATLLLLDPHTFAFYRLGIRYLHTQTEGPVFESMRAQLAGIASHSGMADVFELKGADLYAVRGIEPVPGDSLPPRRPGAACWARPGAAASNWRAATRSTRRWPPWCARSRRTWAWRTPWSCCSTRPSSAFTPWPATATRARAWARRSRWARA